VSGLAAVETHPGVVVVVGDDWLVLLCGGFIVF
jgi:hypothetical protein